MSKLAIRVEEDVPSIGIFAEDVASANQMGLGEVGGEWAALLEEDWRVITVPRAALVNMRTEARKAYDISHGATPTVTVILHKDEKEELFLGYDMHGIYVVDHLDHAAGEEASEVFVRPVPELSRRHIAEETDSIVDQYLVFCGNVYHIRRPAGQNFKLILG